MNTTCPNGHVTETTDYCDQCGTPLEGRATAPPTTAERLGVGSAISDASEVAISPDTTASPPAEPCPRCQTPRVGSDRFCEGCGYSFTTGKLTASSTPIQSARPPTECWQAVADADHAYFERAATSEIEFPAHYQARSFVLEQARLVSVDTAEHAAPSRRSICREHLKTPPSRTYMRFASPRGRLLCTHRSRLEQRNDPERRPNTHRDQRAGTTSRRRPPTHRRLDHANGPPAPG